jgi:hypothetical protein
MQRCLAGKWTMATTTPFTSEKAPCGSIVDGEHFRDQDDDGLVIDHLHYACGCQSVRNEFHDGSVHHRVVHHNGRVVADEREQGQ